MPRFSSMLTGPLTLTLLGCFGPLAPQSGASGAAGRSPVQAVTYSPSSENFANPERGFYQQEEPLNLGEKRTPLSPEQLGSLRAQGISTMRLYLLIDEFRDKPISQGALNFIRGEFGKLRQAGLKAIPRFAYAYPSGGEYPYTDPDAPLSRVLEHIGQLKAVLRENADVIAYQEIGFIGAWGEWHSSTNKLVDPEPNTRTNAASEAIVSALLDALPPSRMVAMRYLRYKRELVGDAPLSSAEAYSGSARARIGAHNDCFLAAKSDWGTYPDDDQARKAVKAALNLDNLYVPQGGETCNAGADALPYIGCNNAQSELARLRFTSLNRGYELKVLSGWKAGGCLADIQRKLGYRYRLMTARAPTTAARGSSLTLNLKLSNDGYARPYNPRKLEVVLRHKASGKVTRISVKPAQDLRLWLPGPAQTSSLELSAALPATLERGAYEVLLNLPDPLLPDRAEYSIRLANADLWEEATGFNRLKMTLNVQ